ncbi:hypothetical protein NMY22_g16569 [Coprinellus aureogranulatus]|nr:hypothetical protein NMY22_g16569 [Coprinellus aureogranulatus]
MPQNARRAKPVRTSSALTFYNWGAPPSEYCDTPTGSRPSTPRSRDGTPQASAGPTRTPRRRASHKVEDKILSSSHSTQRNLGDNSSLSIVSTRASRPLHIDTSIGHGQQQVRFDGSPEVIEPSPDSEYAVPGGVDPDIWKAFMAADADRSGFIDPDELRTALVNIPWNKPFDRETIDMLINIFDLNRNKAIEFNEFRGLSQYVKSWRSEFEKADRDGSGTIDARELKKALARFGYNLPLRVIKPLHQKHAGGSRAQTQSAPLGITFDQFMRACVSVADLGRTFEQQGRDKGTITPAKKGYYRITCTSKPNFVPPGRGIRLLPLATNSPPTRHSGFHTHNLGCEQGATEVMSSLPTEILAEIASILEGEDVPNCVLVSRAFRAIFQPRLYHRLILFDGILPWTTFKFNNAGLLESLNARPELAGYTRTVFIVLDDLREDSDIPKILNTIPRLVKLRIETLESWVDWPDLSAEMKSAVTRVCQLPSLRSLQFNGFKALPGSLLRTNSELRELSVAIVLLFTDGEPHYDLNENRNPPAADIAPENFAGIRELSCFYAPCVKKHQWVRTAIQSSSEAGSLRELSLRRLVPSLHFGLPVSIHDYLDPPFDLNLATNLVRLHLQDVTGDPLTNFDDSKVLFENFCTFVLGTVATIQQSPLELLSLQFTAMYDHKFLLQPAFWDIPVWRDLKRALRTAKTKHFKPSKISFLIQLNSKTLPTEDVQAAISTIKGCVLESEPAFDFTVYFKSTSEF